MNKQKWHKIPLLLSIVFCLVSCATAAQRQVQAIRNNNQVAGAQFKACLANVMQSPEFEPLRSHVPLDIRDATLEQMTDEKKATKAEIHAIYVTFPEVQSCRKSLADSLAQTTPTLVPVFVSEWQKWDSIEIDVIKKKVSWGDAITKAKAIYAESQKELTTAAQQIDNQLRQSHAAEMQQRQQAFANSMQYLQNQELINSMSRPRTTNCMGTGNMVNCTSY